MRARSGQRILVARRNPESAASFSKVAVRWRMRVGKVKRNCWLSLSRLDALIDRNLLLITTRIVIYEVPAYVEFFFSASP